MSKIQEFAPEARLDQHPAPVTRWWWVRHAPVVDAHLMRLSGQADVDVDVSDPAPFAALAPRLPAGALWVVTNLKRTVRTAEALWEAGAERTAPLVEPAFAEQAFGDWTGWTWTDLAERPEAQPFWADPATIAPPSRVTGLKAESFATQCARVAARIESLTAEHPGRDIVAVAHAGTIHAAVALALGLSPAQALGLDVRNVGLTRLDHIPEGLRARRGGHWRVVALNQIC